MFPAIGVCPTGFAVHHVRSHCPGLRADHPLHAWLSTLSAACLMICYLKAAVLMSVLVSGIPQHKQAHLKLQLCGLPSESRVIAICHNFCITSPSCVKCVQLTSTAVQQILGFWLCLQGTTGSQHAQRLYLIVLSMKHLYAT